MAKKSTSSDHGQVSRSLAAELPRALDRDQFFLVYQPEIDLQTNGFAGVEALIRWRHPELGVVDPDSFVPQLEVDGGIVKVGSWALETACAQGGRWHDKGYRFSVSVNVSSFQLERADFVDVVDGALTSSRFDPALLVLEFTQRTLSSGATADSLRSLKSLGVRLAVDDFVPGRTELTELEAQSIDIVKIDRTFIASMSTDSTLADQVHAVVKKAKSMHLQVVASGIEDAEQLRRLRLEEVSVGQGFHFSRPREAAEIDKYLEDFAIFSGKPL
jgi:EAL domain-containing protein (putative c-di-GMP-specific phosphodiesterase class I)